MAERGMIGPGMAVGMMIDQGFDNRKKRKQFEMVSNFLEYASEKQGDPRFEYKDFVMGAARLGINSDPRVVEYGKVFKEVDNRKKQVGYRNQFADMWEGKATPQTTIDPLSVDPNIPKEMQSPQLITQPVDQAQFQTSYGYTPDQAIALSKLIRGGAMDIQTGKDESMLTNVLSVMEKSREREHESAIEKDKAMTEALKSMTTIINGPYKTKVNEGKPFTAADLSTIPVQVSDQVRPTEHRSFNVGGGSSSSMFDRAYQDYQVWSQQEISLRNQLNDMQLVANPSQKAAIENQLRIVQNERQQLGVELDRLAKVEGRSWQQAAPQNNIFNEFNQFLSTKNNRQQVR